MGSQMMIFCLLWTLLFTVHLASCQQGNETGRSEEDLQFIAALENVAGVYKDPAKRVGLGLEKTVFLTGCNLGFINHLHNFKCFMDRLGIQFLVLAMDPFVHEYLVNNTNMNSYLVGGGVVGEVGTDNADFRSHQFNLITQKKKEAVHDVMELGFDVVFSDTDVAVLRDPMPSLLYKNVDYVHSLNSICTK
jgi:hypothetical protein